MNEQYELDFMNSNSSDFESVQGIHPFFRYLQDNFDPSYRFKQQYKAQGTYDPSKMFLIPQTQLEQLTTKKFYRYFLTQNAPMHIVDGCYHWPAMQKWNNEYMETLFTNEKVPVTTIDSYERDPIAAQYGLDAFVFDSVANPKVKQDKMTFQQFFKDQQQFRGQVYYEHLGSDKNGENTGQEVKHMAYINDWAIPHYWWNQLEVDIARPLFLENYLQLMDITYSQVQDYRRKPVFNHQERLVCLLSGKETFRMVSAIFKQNMYSGVFQELDPLETPINLFETDPAKIRKYKLMRLEHVYQAELEAGSCLFIPSYYWFQSKTRGGEKPPALEHTSDEFTVSDSISSFVTFKYESHSLLVDELITALDQGIIDEQ